MIKDKTPNIQIKTILNWMGVIEGTFKKNSFNIICQVTKNKISFLNYRPVCFLINQKKTLQKMYYIPQLLWSINKHFQNFKANFTCLRFFFSILTKIIFTPCEIIRVKVKFHFWITDLFLSYILIYSRRCMVIWCKISTHIKHGLNNGSNFKLYVHNVKRENKRFFSFIQSAKITS